MKYYQRNEKAIQQEMDKSNNGSSFYTFSPGRTVIRVLPPSDESGVWFREIREYYFQQGNQHLFLSSPADFGLRDPLAEWSQEVYEKGNEAAMKEASRFRPRVRYLMNVIVLSDTKDSSLEKGIKVLSSPAVVKEQLVKLDLMREYGDITNPENGFNIIVERTGTGLNTKYSVVPDPKRTNIFEILQNAGIDPRQLELNDLESAHRNDRLV